MHSSQRSIEHRDFLVSDGLYDIQHLSLTPQKLAWIWDMVKSYKTLHSDYGDKTGNTFVNRITSNSSVWFQVMQGDVMVGVVFADLMNGWTDMEGHFFFFDKKPTEKIKVCQNLLKWLFVEFPSLDRISVNVPSIYFSTKRLVLRLGFKEEGAKRNGTRIGGRTHDLVAYGILREDVLNG